MQHLHVMILTTALLVCVSDLASAQELVGESEVDRRMFIVPTLSFNIGSSLRYHLDSENAQKRPHFSAWGGAAIHPWAGRRSPFLALGLEVEPFDLPDERLGFFIMPMMQAGVAFLGCHDDIKPLTATFSCLKLYGLAGGRAGFPGDLPAGRVGLGLNSFWITLAGLHGDVVLPSTLEAIYELDPHGTQVYMFRIGLGF